MSYDKIYKDNIVSGASIRDGKGNRIDTMYLSKSQITNCLLEVPQRIKLELNDGTLTLKAGSQVIVPNGFEADGTTPKFDEVIVESDTTVYRDFATGIDVIYADDNRQIAGWDIGAVHSGSSPKPPSDMYQLWYDTANNLIKATDDGGTTWRTGLSFPVAISSRTINTGFSSIDQVFNGMGYIGSTVWVDKGVKGLIPNGRNEDGSLNNVEWANDELIVRTFTSHNTTGRLIFDPVGTDYNSHLRVFGSDIYLDEDTNTWVTTGTGIMETGLYLTLGDISLNSGVISNFQPKLPFRAVDTSSLTECVVIIDSYVNGTSGYNIYSNGYCEQWGRVSATSQTVKFLKAFANTSYCITGGLIPGTTSATYEHLNIGSLTTTSFYYTCYDGYQLMWRAGGYLAKGAY